MARDIVSALDSLSGGPHEGYRAGHAKGILVGGVFKPAPDASRLTRAVHLRGEEVPVVVRFSNFAGAPSLPDHHAAAAPRGMAIKFMLDDGGATDIVAHSYNGFPAATPEDLLAFLRALDSDDPQVLARHLAAHPEARRFADAPKPPPESYATERYYGVSAFNFTNAEGASRYGKYVLVPAAGTAYLESEDAAARDVDYLFHEIVERLESGQATFSLTVQLAGEGDSLVDGSLPWPADRSTVDLGSIELRNVIPDNAARQREILFTPLSLVGGIAPSQDPMLISRTRAYRVSHQRRATGNPATTARR